MGAVSVVIPNWNGTQVLPRALASLRNQTRPPDEIVVVDNGSTDDSASLATIRFSDNQGFCRAVNRGIAEAHGEWIVILNNDVELHPAWLEHLLQAATESNADFAGGKLLRAADRSIVDGAFDNICRGACAWRSGNARRDGPAWNRARHIWMAPLTAALFRARVFQQIGVLDERFESYLEDVDFGLRCFNAGISGVYVPDAVAYHEGSHTLGAWHPAMVRSIARNQVLLVAKHFPEKWTLRYGWCVVVAQTLWGVLAVRRGAFFPYMRGKWEGICMYPCLRRERSAGDVASLLRTSERDIWELQRETGFDWYWKAYFALTGGVAGKP